MNICKNCLKKNTCTKICPEVDVILDKLNHSFTSIYKVLFVDSSYIEKCFAEVKQYEYIENKRLTELKNLLKKFFKRLTGRQKKCLSLYYGLKDNEMLTQTEIAYLLKISQPAVRKHLYLGKRKLHKLVEKYQKGL